MTWVVLLASAVLAGVAAAGVLRPFGTTRKETLERLADPLQDERLSLLRNLRDLDEERAMGALAEEDYRALRGETETRAVAVLRALEARDRVGELAASLKELRPPATPAGNGASKPGEPASRSAGRRWLGAAGMGALAVAVVVPLLIGAVRNRSGDQPISGGGAITELSFAQQRVQQHPGDIAARLDLAQLYRDGGDLRDAAVQYLAALGIDPQNAGARASLGYILYLSGRSSQGLVAVNQALARDAQYPEALYFKGIILLRGMHRPAQAATMFEQYLQAAPFGAHRDEVQQLLRQARQPSR